MTPQPRWSSRGPIVSGLVTLILLTFGFGGWSMGTTITGAIIVPGRIEVERNRQIVQHPDGGVVASILVVEGDHVSAGDLLIRLDGTALRSELTIVETQLAEVMARKARLEAERDERTDIRFGTALQQIAKTRPEVTDMLNGQWQLFDARRETLSQDLRQLGKRRAQIANQIDGILAQTTALSTQLGLIAKETADQRALLSKGLTQSSRVLALQREAARLQGEIGALLAARAQAEGRITELEIEGQHLVSTRREEATAGLRDTGDRELELIERRNALAERVAGLDILAPVSGIVLGLGVTTPRAVLRPADPVLYLVPQDRPMVIAANLPPIHIDQVHIGQSVRLVFSAFPARDAPDITAHIATVSADSLTDTRTQLPYYRAEIALDPGEQKKLGGLTLIPGMPVEAFIQTQARTPLSYLIKPFTDYFTHAFRES